MWQGQRLRLLTCKSRRGEGDEPGGGSAPGSSEVEALRARVAGLEAAADGARERCCELQAELARQRKRCAHECPCFVDVPGAGCLSRLAQPGQAECCWLPFAQC